MVFDFHPYNKPTFKNKIIFPEDKKIYVKEYHNKNYYLEGNKFQDININLDKLNKGRTMNDNTYTLDELKDYAKQLDIEKISGASKKELIQKIKLKIQN